jgi:hypothetical protein
MNGEQCHKDMNLPQRNQPRHNLWFPGVSASVKVPSQLGIKEKKLQQIHKRSTWLLHNRSVPAVSSQVHRKKKKNMPEYSGTSHTSIRVLCNQLPLMLSSNWCENPTSPFWVFLPLTQTSSLQRQN